MHALVLIDSEPENLGSALDFLSREREGCVEGREFFWNVKAREIRLYDLCFPEEFEGEVMSEVNAFSNGRIKNILRSRPIRYIQRFYAFLGMRASTGDDSRRLSVRALFKRLFPAERERYFYTVPLGVLEDKHWPSGGERL